MKSWNIIKNELIELNSSLPLDKVPEVFAVPEGYFETFSDSVWQKIKSRDISAKEELESLSPVLAGLSKKMPFSVPQGYFSEVSDNIPGIVAEEQLPEILLQAGKSMPYEIPTGYFDNLAGEILEKLPVSRPAAKVISLGSRTWMRYVVAAAIAGIIAVSGIFYFGGNKTIDPSASSEIWVAKQLKNISDQELDAFITNTDVSATLAQNTQKGETEIRSLLKDVSNSELEKFLNDIPSDNEDALGIN